MQALQERTGLPVLLSPKRTTMDNNNKSPEGVQEEEEEEVEVVELEEEGDAGRDHSQSGVAGDGPGRLSRASTATVPASGSIARPSMDVLNMSVQSVKDSSWSGPDEEDDFDDLGGGGRRESRDVLDMLP